MGFLSTVVPFAVAALFFFLLSLRSSAQPLSRSQSKTLLRLPRLLEYPPVLAGWSNSTAFCYILPTPSLSVSCDAGRVTGLSVVGGASGPLSPAFSSDSLFTTLSRLPDLTYLSLVSLGLCGPLPAKVDRLASLQVLNLSSNYFSGAIPPELSRVFTLQNLILSWNLFNGTVPDLHPLSAILELDLSGNNLGQEFPSLSSSLVTLSLRNNSFADKIPANLASFDQLRRLDLSFNELHGLVPAFLFLLPSMQYLDLSENRLTGEVPANSSCSINLSYVDISNNLIVGRLPSCIQSNSSNRVVLSSGNCLSAVDLGFQHPNTYCNQGALAAVLPSANKISGSKSNLGLIFGIVGGAICGAVLVGLLGFLIFRKMRSAKDEEDTRNIFEKTNVGKSFVHVAPRSPLDARHMSPTVMIGTLGLEPYQIFSIEDLEEATNSFDPSNLIEDGAQGQAYKGWIRDGSSVIIRCLRLNHKLSRQSLLQYMDIVSKLRHRHLVSIIGYCVANDSENTNTIDAIFLVFEHVSNGSLRFYLGESRKTEITMTLSQRVSATIGVARGIQFLHTVTVPGIVGNDLNIENILLDQTFTAKISNYNLPTLANFRSNKLGSRSPLTIFAHKEDLGSIDSVVNGEKEDIYQFGLILLEIVTGKPPGSNAQLDSLRAKLEKSLVDKPASLKGFTDMAIRGSSSVDSLSRVVEVSLNCLSKDPKQRPCIDDVIWNLQYSVQVQDDWDSNESFNVQI
ncbi:probable LRR receptor-like serine/threonine-protein kinase At1g14390 [Zingiber officinale]|uniref:Protein kinase domain-containing protein n=1 Tax=Zingiber officinale TaxID=94328 RepID=A0A8J5F7T2_ZINOF|nr:probable LRR receptor-like serine/threonine-protein kinase At1g14390 [Zingiber officinale]KAG6481312.1 hypothetical protein ZIOFF_057908 [Zingiber officinale]